MHVPPMTAKAASSPSVRRLFIVGCPRSGTTVVQAALAALPGVVSVGETEFVLRLLGRFDGWLHDRPDTARVWRRRMRLVSARRARKLQAHMDRAFGDSQWSPRLRRRLTGRACIDEFRRVLDATAARSGSTCWVEKTPDHLAYVEVIAKHIPDAHFLHVVRNGEDVIASAIDGQLRFLEHEVFHGSLPYWVERWNRAARAHVELAGHPRHTVLPYECLFSAHDQVHELLRRLAGSGDGQPTADEVPSSIADLAQEPWKHGSTDGVVRQPEHKAAQMFGPRMRVQLAERLSDYAGVIERIAAAQPELPWIASATGGLPPAARPQG